MTNISFKHFKLHTITLLQISIAIFISLLFQFIIPFSWQPLDTFLYGIKQHGDPGTNITIFTISQWYFSISLTWFICRDNPYINNFLIYSIVPLGIIVVYELFFLYLYYDYIHIFPVIIAIYLIWKKRETLSQKYALYIIPINVSWLLLVYFLKLAYYNEILLIYVRNVLIYLVLWILLSFLFSSKKRDVKNE
ncbi:MAG: hypothetical protein JSV62_07250 [Promethearchaeota archaeon]|nr:MAG: hypothetical protein JSV62_07250 [Candidatus Lokiarchaeota archaeon]